MVKFHSAFSLPSSGAKLWRFMTLAELVSLLSKRALFFSRVDRLDDPFEGSLPKVVVARAERGFERLTPDGRDILRSGREHVGYLQSKPWTMVSCWYENEHESAAMWTLHASEGVSVQSTYQRFVDAVAPAPQEIVVGQVRYLDYEREGWDADRDPRTILSVFHKRKSFEHEREFRAAICEPIPGGVYNCADGPGFVSSPGVPGVYVQVDPAQLVEKIYVAPGLPSWFRDAVTTVAETAGLGARVNQSRLDDEPVW